MTNYELELAGIDVPDMMARLINNTKLARLIVESFLQDESYAHLCQAIARGDMKQAEFDCHTLKGICGNMSLKTLYMLLQEQLRLFRAGEPQRAVDMMQDISAHYETAVTHLKAWLTAESL